MMLAVGLRSAPCSYLLSTIMFYLSQCLNFFCLLCLILLLQCLILLSLSYLIHLILYVDSLIPCVYSLIHCLTLFCFMNDNSVSSDQVDVEFHVFLFECWMFSFVLFSDLTLDYAGYDVVPVNVDLFRYGRCSLPLCWCCGSRTDLLVDVIISHQRGIFLFTIWICPSCLWFSCSLNDALDLQLIRGCLVQILSNSAEVHDMREMFRCAVRWDNLRRVHIRICWWTSWIWEHHPPLY